jgi:hypothetical protein
VAQGEGPLFKPQYHKKKKEKKKKERKNELCEVWKYDTSEMKVSPRKYGMS